MQTEQGADFVSLFYAKQNIDAKINTIHVNMDSYTVCRKQPEVFRSVDQ